MLAVALLGLMAGIQGADPTISSTALAEASSSLGMTGGVQALSASISTFVLAGNVISTGLLADRIGRRKVLAGALVLSIVGDVMVAAAPVAPVHLLDRSLAGVGLGAVFAAAFAYLRAVVPRPELAKANGTFAAIMSAAMIAMAVLGGALASSSWRLAFLVVPAASALALCAMFAVLPRLDPVSSGRPDIIGQLLLALGVIALLYGISVAGNGLAEPTTWGPILGGAVLLGLRAVEQQRSSRSFFPMSLFRNPLFIAAVAVGFIYDLGQAVIILQTANLWQYLDRYSTIDVSLGQWPYLFAVVAFSFLAGHWTNGRLTQRAAATSGRLAFALAMAWLAFARTENVYVIFVPGLVLAGFGTGLVQVVFGNLFLKLAPAKALGPVTSAKTTIGQIAYSIGLSVSVILVNAGTDGGVTRRLTDAGASPASVGQGMDAIKVYTAHHVEPSTQIGRQALSDATTSYGNSFTTVMLVAAGALALLTVAANVLMRGESRHGEVPEHV